MKFITENNFLSKKFLIGLILLLFVILLSLLAIDGYFDLNKNVKTHTSNMIDMIDQRMTPLFFEINNFPRHIGDNLLFLSKLSSLRDVINFTKGEARDSAIRGLEKDFLEFIKGSSTYYQLRYLDEEGNEVVRVEFDGEDYYKVVSEDELQNKKGRYYFNETINFSEGEVFISPLDLNIEGGEIENRGTEESPEYVPVMRYATPVFSEEGMLRGIIIFNTYVSYFLEDIRMFQREGEAVFLINKEGYYLVHSDKTKEFSFMLGGDNNFFNDYPKVSQEALSDFSERMVETEDLIFSLKYIFPTIGNFEIHKGSKRIFGENPENNYFWILISVSDKSKVNEILEDSRESYLFFLLSSGLIILVIIILMLALAFKVSDDKLSRKNEK